MRHVRKPTKLRRQFRATEVIVRKVESLEMLKSEKAAIGMDGTLKLTATNVDADDMTSLVITCDPIPCTTICTIYPGICLGI